METLIKFLLTEWAGAPLAIWFLLVMAVVVMFTVGRSLRIKFKPLRGEIEIDNNPPVRKRTK